MFAVILSEKNCDELREFYLGIANTVNAETMFSNLVRMVLGQIKWTELLVQLFFFLLLNAFDREVIIFFLADLALCFKENHDLLLPQNF